MFMENSKHYVIFQMTTTLSKVNNLSLSFALLNIILFLVSTKQKVNIEFLSHHRERVNRRYYLNNKIII